MDIKGRDIATECYRVVHDVDGRPVTALVPERLAGDARYAAARPSHQTAYAWIADHKDRDHKDRIETAIAQLARGGKRPKAPFDQITLVKEH